MDISLILPTRRRIPQLARALESLVATARRPERIEVIIYADRDDPPTREFRFPDLTQKTISGPRCRMGQMTRRCYAAASGRIVMLANDDVCFRTPGWDERVLAAAARFPDGVGLVWANDLEQTWPSHPFLPRITCELLGRICPPGYERIFIDTHIYDVFRRLARRGHDRLAYLPEVIIEHLHAGGGKSEADETYRKLHCGADEQLYISWADERERLAGRMARWIENAAQGAPAATELRGRGAEPARAGHAAA